MEIPGYEINRCIGQGGMATAYLATQTSLERQVVLKVLDTSVSDSPITIERFLNEGRIVASLQHPNIITTYDIGTAGTDVFISMEFVDGGDLKQRLREQIFSPSEAVSLISKIASALAAAHAKGIIHRDVKPGNILFRADGTPLLSDFGIAKRLTGDADLTSTGMFVGSPNYMAPEQSAIGALDGRVDIYALGVIFFEMLAGKKPYFSESVIDVILMHKRDPVPTLPAGLEDYQEMLNLMMAKDRNDRFRDAESLLHYIERSIQQGLFKPAGVLAREPDFDVTGTQPAPTVTRVSLGSTHRPKLRVALSAIAVLCAAAYGVLMLIERRMAADEVPRSVLTTTTIDLIADEAFSSTGEASNLGANVQPEKVVAALRWLGTHSLNEYRLTAPPKDNAYYYFSRLLQMDPNDEIARQGLLQIAARYAILAEREIADGNHEQARSYIAVGLQVDPENKSLPALSELAVPTKHGFLAALFRLFE